MGGKRLLYLWGNTKLELGELLRPLGNASSGNRATIRQAQA
jgi:hypothetical protein